MGYRKSMRLVMRICKDKGEGEKHLGPLAPCRIRPLWHNEINSRGERWGYRKNMRLAMRKRICKFKLGGKEQLGRSS